MRAYIVSLFDVDVEFRRLVVDSQSHGGGGDDDVYRDDESNGRTEGKFNVDVEIWTGGVEGEGG